MTTGATTLGLHPSASLGDRLTAALEAIVLGDRWAYHRRGGDDQICQAGLLRVALACAEGDGLRPRIWQAHFQGLPSTAAVLTNALPYLWINADAHGHQRAMVSQWAAELALGAAAARACDQLFGVLCQTMGAVSAAAAQGEPAAHLECRLEGGDSDPLDPLAAALALTAQSQGQMAVALALADRRGGASADIALVGLLLGLTQGRTSLGAGLRQRWLIEHCAPGVGQPALSHDDLAEVAMAIYRRWAGLGGRIPIQPLAPFPLGIGV
ncbi:MAG: hypothetical protein EA368_09300 [Leptolyngbya sp. DLM2.Bin27]|nr:MAG: hypothetical protein EA368_09300 [Leptolyngbya sp. DLM2.Bin27]